jgi:hypothetical protein
LLAAAFCSVTQAESLRIVVAGDGRADSRPRPEDRDGINVTITSEIARAVLKENAQVLLWTGDLVNCPRTDASRLEHQLRAWRTIMQPLYDHGVAVLPVRGNHEVRGPDPARVWSRVFSGKYALPDNGPPGEQDLTFFYLRGQALIVGLDEYAGGRETIDQSWLDRVLAEQARPFVFVYGHEPAFMDGHHKDTLDRDPAARDAFWRSLIRAGGRSYFCGHDHFYDHMTVVRAGPEPGVRMHQFTAGTAGAPFYQGSDYAGKNPGWQLRRVKHLEKIYGYLLITVDDDTATITFKGRTAPDRFEPGDSFSYRVPSVPATPPP